MYVYNKTAGRLEVAADFMLGASKEQLLDYGLYPVIYFQEPDRRYYTSIRNDSFNSDLNQYEINYTAVERSLQDVKLDIISEIKEKQKQSLDTIDWYWLRELKTGVPVPQNVKDFATNIYSISDSKETTINNFTTISEIISYRETSVRLLGYPKSQVWKKLLI